MDLFTSIHQSWCHCVSLVFLVVLSCFMLSSYQCTEWEMIFFSYLICQASQSCTVYVIYFAWKKETVHDIFLSLLILTLYCWCRRPWYDIGMMEKNATGGSNKIFWSDQLDKYLLQLKQTIRKRIKNNFNFKAKLHRIFLFRTFIHPEICNLTILLERLVKL